jgi:hypothetical protein
MPWTKSAAKVYFANLGRPTEIGRLLGEAIGVTEAMRTQARA